MMAGSGPRQRGFTLIEVVVVMFVLALASAVVVPAVGRGTEALQARTEVAGLSAFLRYARQQAITRRESQEVRIDPQAHRAILTAVGSAEVRSSRRLHSALRIDASPPAALTVRFLPQGLSTGGTFRIEAPGGRVYLITVEPLTGRVLNRRA
jgi:general secretion pathway protein H